MGAVLSMSRVQHGLSDQGNLLLSATEIFATDQ